MSHQPHRHTSHAMLVGASLFALFALALGLRLIVWRWREPYPLGGDEQEYLGQALALLQQKQYIELRLMRPPGYTVFLAGAIYLFDSTVQNLRLVQAVISALTVVPVYGLTWQLFRSHRTAFIAGLLVALNYTLAATATELLTETVFVFGLSLVLWLLLAARGRKDRWLLVVEAGLALGMLALVRSVALPLVALGAMWLLARAAQKLHQKRTAVLTLPVLFAASALLIILPWTARNYLTYGAPILIDTTGAENLWLDNNPSAATTVDPLGREAAKAELYALGDDRAARQSLATQRGSQEISSNPGWFVHKAWGEAKKFFALQYVDELREKRAIWVPPAEVWAKLVLGDGMWLLVLFGGLAGWCLHTENREQRTENKEPGTENRELRTKNKEQRTKNKEQRTENWETRIGKRESGTGNWLLVSAARFSDPRWLFVPWALYIFATAMLFHVELRYRLPVYPVLVPFAARVLTPVATHKHTKSRFPRLFVFASSCLLALSLMLLHQPYPAQAWMLANKHVALAAAERALDTGDPATARAHAETALRWDDRSALAHVALARAALLSDDWAGATEALDQAITALPAHPQAHLLQGALLRQNGKTEAARSELAYETGSLENLQAWSWQAFAPITSPTPELAVGDGLDLGFVQGFHPAENNARWTKAEARMLIGGAQTATTLELELASGRPSDQPNPTVIVYNGTQQIGELVVGSEWQTYQLPFSSHNTAEIVLRVETFRPRALDRANTDNRDLGVLVRHVALRNS